VEGGEAGWVVNRPPASRPRVLQRDCQLSSEEVEQGAWLDRLAGVGAGDGCYTHLEAMKFVWFVIEWHSSVIERHGCCGMRMARNLDWVRGTSGGGGLDTRWMWLWTTHLECGCRADCALH